jgi:hypothetical protein
MTATVPIANVTNSKAGEHNPFLELEDRFCCSAIKTLAGTKIPTASGPASRALAPSKLTDIHKVTAPTAAPTASCTGTNQDSGQTVGSFGSRSNVRSFSQFGSHCANTAASKT